MVTCSSVLHGVILAILLEHIMEVILTIKEGNRDQAEKLLRDAIVKTNEELKLNRELDIDVQFGNSYAQIH